MKLGTISAELRVLVVAVLATSTVFAFDAMPASAAVVTAPPTWPISTTTHGPPPIPTLSAAGDVAPPAGQIDDPVTAGASCTGWYQQSSYGERWPAGSTWWEYACSHESDSSYDNCGGGACNTCDYCYVETEQRTDYFYWDGSDAVFYGEYYYYNYYYWGNLFGDGGSEVTAWWDAPTAEWYDLEPVWLTVAKQGNGSGAVDSSPAFISCGSTCQVNLVPGTVVTLTASPDASSTFTGWSGDCSGTGTCQVTMDQARAVTATFVRNTVDLTASRAGTGSGSVTSNPAGISCGDSCQASFDRGTLVTLTASPDPGSVFAGWSGDCTGTGTCQVMMDQARSVTASFARTTVNLTVSRLGSGSGHVGSVPAGIDCGTACQAGFDPGSILTLTAVPDPGSVFTGWSGDCTGTGTCQVTMNQTRSVTATFTVNTPPQAGFSASCTYLTCTVDGSTSHDSDGTITGYAWSFGDGTSGTGQSASHTYPQPSSYAVTLTITDNAGATGTHTTTINPIRLTAHGYKQAGVAKVDLSWTPPNSNPVTIYRNTATLTSVATTSYTDTLGKVHGSFSYRVCAAGGTTCSNQVTVTL